MGELNHWKGNNGLLEYKKMGEALNIFLLCR